MEIQVVVVIGSSVSNQRGLHILRVAEAAGQLPPAEMPEAVQVSDKSQRVVRKFVGTLNNRSRYRKRVQYPFAIPNRSADIASLVVLPKIGLVVIGNLCLAVEILGDAVGGARAQHSRFGIGIDLNQWHATATVDDVLIEISVQIVREGLVYKQSQF